MAYRLEASLVGGQPFKGLSPPGDSATRGWDEDTACKVPVTETNLGLHQDDDLSKSPAQVFYRVLVSLASERFSGFRGKSGSDLEFLIHKLLE